MTHRLARMRAPLGAGWRTGPAAMLVALGLLVSGLGPGDRLGPIAQLTPTMGSVSVGQPGGSWAGPASSSDVLVQLRPGVSQARAVAELTRRGWRVQRSLPLVDALSVAVPSGTGVEAFAATVRTDPLVRLVAADTIRRLDSTASAQGRATAVGNGLRALHRRASTGAGWAGTLAATPPGTVGLASASTPIPVPPNDPLFGQQWGLYDTGQVVAGSSGPAGVGVQAPDAWALETGAPSVTVAVIDTGVDISHPDLSGAIWTNPKEIPGNGIDDDHDGYVDDVHGWDFVHNDNKVFSATDGDEHGTHVAGTIAATANNGIGVAGVAPGVRIMPLKVFDSAGQATDATIIAAISYAKAHGARIVNASWVTAADPSQPGGDPLLAQALASSGMLVVAAAGNTGTNNDTSPVYPASFALPNLVSVAAVGADGALSAFSDYGRHTVDVAAPGVNILSTLPPLAAGTAATVVHTASTDAQWWGFGLEDVTGPSARADMLSRGLSALGVSATDPVLLVDDDEDTAANPMPDVTSYWQAALSADGYNNVTTYQVQAGSAGPSAATMAGHVVIWSTGYADGEDAPIGDGPLLPADRTSLTSFLGSGGRLLLSGAGALFESETSSFVTSTLSIRWLRNEDRNTNLVGASGTSFAGTSYLIDGSQGPLGQPSPYRDVAAALSPAVPLLSYPAASDYSQAYGFLSGTSMATPHVSGVAALVASAFPGLGAVALANRVELTVKASPAGAQPIRFPGLVSAPAALQPWPVQASGSVTRASGADRFGTAAAVAGLFPVGVPVAFVATGSTFPDALAGAAVAGAQGAPVLLTSPTSLPSVTASALARLKPARIVVLGGTSAVADAELSTLAPLAVP